MVEQLELGKLLYGVDVVEVVEVTGADAISLHHRYQTLMRHFIIKIIKLNHNKATPSGDPF